MTEIKTYNIKQADTTKVFVKINDGEISSVIVGNQAISLEQGFQFYVDDFVADQIDKCEFYLDGLIPKLRVRNGEEIIKPELTDKEKEIRRLQAELEALRNS